ncbi:MAG: Tryptophan synthase alpha chain, partial [uncultured Gemmatimonadetes bacterium]
ARRRGSGRDRAGRPLQRPAGGRPHHPALLLPGHRAGGGPALDAGAPRRVPADARHAGGALHLPEPHPAPRPRPLPGRRGRRRRAGRAGHGPPRGLRPRAGGALRGVAAGPDPPDRPHHAPRAGARDRGGLARLPLLRLAHRGHGGADHPGRGAGGRGRGRARRHGGAGGGGLRHLHPRAGRGGRRLRGRGGGGERAGGPAGARGCGGSAPAGSRPARGHAAGRL